MRKRDADGHLIGTKHDNPALDSHIYTVQYDDGHTEDYVYNAIVEALYSQVDEQGNKFWIMRDIVGHKRDLKASKGKTKGWRLEVEWKDGTTTWEMLSSLKETNMVEVTQYAVANNLQDENAFKWWVPHAIHKHERIIKLTKRRRSTNRFKYGIELPRNIAHAHVLDRANRNTLWGDAIKKEMDALAELKVFQILKRGEKAPAGYKQIPLLMKFDVKMDLRRKARLCAGGHVTDVERQGCVLVDMLLIHPQLRLTPVLLNKRA